MPRIEFFENDNTGSAAATPLAGVFVPGEATIVTGKADANGCVTIHPYTDDISEYITKKAGTSNKISSYQIVETLTSLGYEVIYKSISTTPDVDATEVTKIYIPVKNMSEALFGDGSGFYIYRTDEKKYEQASSPFDDTDATTYYVEVGVPKTPNPLSTVSDWSFLCDKNAYDIKFITAGPFGNVAVTNGTLQGTTKYAFDFSILNIMNEQVAGVRKDCVVIADLDYSAVDASITSMNELVTDFKTALEYNNVSGTKKPTITYDSKDITSALESASISMVVAPSYIFATTIDAGTVDISSRAFAILSNVQISDTNGGIVTQMSVPSSVVYLNQFAKVAEQSSKWLPVAGVNRGVIPTTYTPTKQISKYLMDKSIITDNVGISFNAIVDINGYGNTIWGDRTLLNQVSGRNIQATSYISIRNLISDLAKEAYASAIAYTYETNNDVTWLNFKTRIVTLLEQMVASGVLQTYTVKRSTPKSSVRNTMAAIITIYPQLPVENFEITVNIENAEITLAE